MKFFFLLINVSWLSFLGMVFFPNALEYPLAQPYWKFNVIITPLVLVGVLIGRFIYKE